MTVVVANKDAYIEKLLADIGNRAVEKTRLVGELERQTEARRKAEAEVEAARRWMAATNETLVDIAKAVGYEPGPDAYEIILRVRRVVAALTAAEAQRDRLEAALRQLDQAIYNAPQVIDDAEYFRGIARSALREIEGGKR